MRTLRSAALYAGLAALSLALGLLSPLALLLPLRPGHWLMTRWNVAALGWVRLCCGIRYEIQGRENIPPTGPYVVVSNHQSAFETILMMVLFPHPTFVLRRSLLRIPFLGWGLAATRPIAIDRNSPLQSFKLMMEQARKRLGQKQVIVIYPEGTRMPPGTRRPYLTGGAHIAVRHGVPLLPVVHNAGHFWPRAFLKQPGTITVRIGRPIRADGMSAADLNEQTRDWILENGAQLSPPA